MAILEIRDRPNVVLKLGSVCPPPPPALPAEFCRSLALGNWLGNSGAVNMAGVMKPVEDMALEEALLKVRPGGGTEEDGEWFRDGVG